MKINRDKKYEGHSNEKIISINSELNDLSVEINRLEKEKIAIQLECDHSYLFVCSGMHEDAFQCEHCGHERWF